MSRGGVFHSRLGLDAPVVVSGLGSWLLTVSHSISLAWWASCRTGSLLSIVCARRLLVRSARSRFDGRQRNWSSDESFSEMLRGGTNSRGNHFALTSSLESDLVCEELREPDFPSQSFAIDWGSFWACLSQWSSGVAVQQLTVPWRWRLLAYANKIS